MAGRPCEGRPPDQVPGRHLRARKLPVCPPATRHETIIQILERVTEKYTVTSGPFSAGS